MNFKGYHQISIKFYIVIPRGARTRGKVIERADGVRELEGEVLAVALAVALAVRTRVGAETTRPGRRERLVFGTARVEALPQAPAVGRAAVTLAVAAWEAMKG